MDLTTDRCTTSKGGFIKKSPRVNRNKLPRVVLGSDWFHQITLGGFVRDKIPKIIWKWSMLVIRDSIETQERNCADGDER